MARSQEACAGVSLEQVAAAHIAADRVHGAVTRHFCHLQHIRPGLGGGGEKPGAQRVPGEPGGIEAGGGGAALEGADEAVVAEWGGADTAAFARPGGTGDRG